METVPLPKEKSYFYILFLITLVLIVFVVVSLLTIIRDKNIYLTTSITKSKAQAQLLGENTSGILFGADLALLSIVSMIERKDTQCISVPVTIAEAIKKQTVFLPQVNNVILLNNEKKVVYSLKNIESFDLIPFEDHQHSWLEFSINTVFSKENKKLIVLSRRVETLEGDFAGVLVGIIDPIFFYDRYENYLNIDVDAVVLLDAKQNILTSWGKGADFFSELRETALGGGGIKTIQTSESIISIYQLPDFPFQLVVLHNKDSILSQWRQKSKQDLAIILSTVLIGIITMAMALNQRKKRKIADENLIKHQIHLEEMVEKRTVKLQKALDEIKTLKGIIPICSYCKKIRDDQGYWKQLENYIQEHSQAEFSHSICKECAREHYPDLDIYGD